MSQKVDLSSALVLGGSGLLVVSLFLRWFGAGDAALSGWTAFESLDLVLTALAAGSAAVALGRLDVLWPTAARWLPAIAGAVLVIVVVQLVDPPPIAQDTDREAGIWIAGLASLAMAAGAALSVARVSVVLDVRGRDLRRSVPVVDRRPGSSAGAAPDPEPVNRSVPPSRRAAAAARPAPEPEPEPDADLDLDEATDPDRTQAFDVLTDDTGERSARKRDT